MGDSLAAVVLAAGAGARLRPLTRIRPKALCPVGNVPLVDAAIERARRVTPAVAVNVHHGRALLEAHLAGRVHLSIEADRALGTAGGLANLRTWLAGRAALVLNADAWHEADLNPCPHSCRLLGVQPTWKICEYRALAAHSGAKVLVLITS